MESNQEYAVSFTLTEEDVIGGNLLHLMATYKRPKTYIAFIVVFAAFMTLIFILDRPTCWCQIRHALLSGAAGVGGMVLVCALLSFAFLPSRSRKVYRQLKAIQREQTVTIAPEAVRFEAPDMLYNCPWSDLAKWNENKRYVLLYASDQSFHLLPARALKDEARAALRVYLTTAGVRKDR